MSLDTLFLVTSYAMLVFACLLGLVGLAMVVFPDWFLR